MRIYIFKEHIFWNTEDNKFCIILFLRPVAQFWLERRIDIAEVDGSSPFGSTTLFTISRTFSNSNYKVTRVLNSFNNIF